MHESMRPGQFDKVKNPASAGMHRAYSSMRAFVLMERNSPLQLHCAGAIVGTPPCIESPVRYDCSCFVCTRTVYELAVTNNRKHVGI